MFVGALEPYPVGTTFESAVEVVDLDGEPIENLDECTFELRVLPEPCSDVRDYVLRGTETDHIDLPGPGIIRWRWTATEMSSILSARQSYRLILTVSKDDDTYRLLDCTLAVV